MSGSYITPEEIPLVWFWRHFFSVNEYLYITLWLDLGNSALYKSESGKVELFLLDLRQKKINVNLVIFRLGFWKKSNLMRWLCVRVFLKNIWKHVHPCLWWSMATMEGIFRLFLKLSKIPIFGCLAAIIRSKFAQNFKFSQSRWGIFFGRV